MPLESISLSSDGQASLPHFDAQGRLLDLQVAPMHSLHASIVAAVREHGLDFAVALTTATLSPANIWGLPRKGRIEVGADADLLLLDRDTLALRATIAGGQVHRFDAA